MKKLTFLLIILGSLLVSNSASAFTLDLQNWRFDPSAAIAGPGIPGQFSPIDEITFIGSTFINQAGAGGPGTAFSDVGFFSATGFANDGVPLLGGVTELGNEYELTGVFSATGVNTTLTGTNQEFVFNAGGTLDLYLDTGLDYGSTGNAVDSYGADNGTLIASFSLLSGSGNFDFDPLVLDGRIDILWEATFLAAGVWADENGDDLSLLIGGPTPVGAATDSNNNAITPPADLVTEIIEEFGAAGTPDSAGDFYTFNDGSLNPTIIPEPGTMLLFGIGLLGFAGIGRRRFS